jgi:adenylate kinase
METLLETIFRKHIRQKGIILDGYPRTIPQVDALMRILQRNNLRINHAVNITVPPDVLLERAKKRAETSERLDDKNPGTHLKRIRIFEEETRPAIAYLATLTPVHEVDGLGSIPEITGKLMEAITV